jgi:ATP-dependent Clp protease, protease subunit
MKKKQPNAPGEHPTKDHGETDSTSRNIFLFGRLENEVALPAVKRFLKLDKASNEPITLYINSSGGNGYNADAIIAVMQSIQSTVNTVCLGHALSGALEILASGTGTRGAYEFATLMFHQTLWEADGDITNLEIQAAQGQRFREAQIELLHRCTGKEKARIRKDIERDFYLSSAEALKYGVIDYVIYHRSNRPEADSNESRVIPHGKLQKWGRK